MPASELKTREAFLTCSSTGSMVPGWSDDDLGDCDDDRAAPRKPTRDGPRLVSPVGAAGIIAVAALFAIVALTPGCIKDGRPANLPKSDVFGVVTAQLAEALKLAESPPSAELTQSDSLLARFALYNFGRKATQGVRLRLTLLVEDDKLRSTDGCSGLVRIGDIVRFNCERVCPLQDSYFIAGAETGGVDADKTWSSGDVVFDLKQVPCPPCRGGKCRGVGTISFTNKLLPSGEPDESARESSPVEYRFEFSFPFRFARRETIPAPNARSQPINDTIPAGARSQMSTDIILDETAIIIDGLTLNLN